MQGFLSKGRPSTEVVLLGRIAERSLPATAKGKERTRPAFERDNCTCCGTFVPADDTNEILWVESDYEVRAAQYFELSTHADSRIDRKTASVLDGTTRSVSGWRSRRRSRNTGSATFARCLCLLSQRLNRPMPRVRHRAVSKKGTRLRTLKRCCLQMENEVHIPRTWRSLGTVGKKRWRTCRFRGV